LFENVLIRQSSTIEGVGCVGKRRAGVRRESVRREREIEKKKFDTKKKFMTPFEIGEF
jgi:hypothetical protein